MRLSRSCVARKAQQPLTGSLSRVSGPVVSLNSPSSNASRFARTVREARYRKAVPYASFKDPYGTVPLPEQNTTSFTPPSHFLASDPPPDVPKDGHPPREFAEHEDLDALPVGFIESKPDAALSHRWVLTLAMGLAFVICNMDKVRSQGEEE